MECKSVPARRNCIQNCNRTLECGHSCKKSCAKQCSSEDCKELILQKIDKLACGHDKVWVFCCDSDKGNIFINYFNKMIYTYIYYLYY